MSLSAFFLLRPGTDIFLLISASSSTSSPLVNAVRAGHFQSSEVTFEMPPSRHRNDLRDKGDDHIGSQMDVDSDEGPKDGDVYEPSDEYELSDEPSNENESSDGYESRASSSLIRKPPGEVGRPGRGGYNLQTLLRNYGWSTKSFEKMREYIFKLIDKHLDTGLSFIYQDDEAVQTVVDAATKHFPQFKDFKNAWPILDFCKMRLKYTASRSRRKAERLAADMFDAQQVKFSLFRIVDTSLTMNKEYSEAFLSLRALVLRMINIESLLVRR
ncbi:hypothetical protein ACEPAF_1122 [Sanghuangporus sanghuang]